MTEYKITFQVVKNQKTVNFKTFYVKKSKYDTIKKFTKTLLKRHSKKQYPKYSNS